MSSILAGIGTAQPDAALDTNLLIAHAKQFSCRTSRQERVLEELYRRTEIRTRASVVTSYAPGTQSARMFQPPTDEDDRGPTTATRMKCYSNEAGQLAVKACSEALLHCGSSAGDVTHLITVSCTGFYAPGFDFEIVKALDLPKGTQRTHVGFMGCHGALNALRVALAYAESQPHATILLCAVELCSLHFQYGWHTDKLVANSLFSDGAGALVIKGAEDQAGCKRGRHIASGSVIIADTGDAMQWQIGDHGFEMHLSTKVPDIVADCLPGWLPNWLAQFGLALADVSGFAVHPGGPRILDAVERSLALPPTALQLSREVLAQCGNMSSPTVLFIIQRLMQAGVKGPCVVLGFGPGLTVEAALLELA